MEIKELFSVVSGLIMAAAFIPYGLSIFRGMNKALPRKSSWIIWSAAEIITLVGMLAKHSANGQIIASATGNLVIVALVLKYGEAGWEWLDKACLAGAGVAIILWMVFEDANFGIAMSILVILIGSFPTWKSVWKNSKNEDNLSWVMFWSSCIFAIMAVPRLTVADVLQPVAYAITNTTMMFLMFIRPWIKKTQRS